MEQEETVAIRPAGGDSCCSGCGGAAAVAAASYVYAIGRVEPRFPQLSTEKEFAQAAARSDTTGRTDRQTLHQVLTKAENRYLARRMCWVFTIEGLEVYILRPRDSSDLDRLLEAIRPQPSPLDLDVVVGRRGPLASPDACNGLIVPIVVPDQLYSFDRVTLIQAIPRPDKLTDKQFAAASQEVLDRILHMTDNAGGTGEHRALNYLAMRYPGIYTRTAEQFARDFALSAVEVRPSPLGQTRTVVDAIFAYTNRRTDFSEKFFARVDVTETFPFLVSKLSPYYDR